MQLKPFSYEITPWGILLMSYGFNQYLRIHLNQAKIGSNGPGTDGPKKYKSRFFNSFLTNQSSCLFPQNLKWRAFQNSSAITQTDQQNN